MKAYNAGIAPVEFLGKFAVILLFVAPVYVGGVSYFFYYLVGFTPWDSSVLRIIGIVIGAIVGTIGAIMATIYIIKFGHEEK